MKLKKLFAGILAVAMMATMAAPAFAARASSDYSQGTKLIQVADDGSFTIKKEFTGNTGSTTPDEQFELEVEKVSASNSGITDEAFKTAGAYPLTIEKAENKDGSVISNFKVTLPTFGKPGVFVYKLHEKDNGTAGITYDNNDYYLTVYVTQKSDAANTSAVNDLQYAVRLSRGLEALNDKTSNNYKVDTINNSYTAEPLSISKTVNGNMGDRTQPFDFEVAFTSDKSVKSTITVSGTHGEITGVTLNNNNEFTFDKEATLKFTLTHGQTINFTNLPEGVSYTVKEVNVPEGYKTYINEADTTATGTEGTISNTAVTISYENVNGDTTIDTGVILDNAPYIALMMVVVAGAAVMIIKKRRHFED